MAKKKTGFGHSIRDNRTRLGLTQGELAARLGCTDSYCAHLEREFRMPSEKLIAKMAEVFDWSDEDHDAFQEAVVDERAKRSVQRIRTRGVSIRAAPRTRGGAPQGAPDASQIAGELAADPELALAYRRLSAVLGDPSLRETILQTLETFAAQAATRASPRRSGRSRT